MIGSLNSQGMLNKTGPWGNLGSHLYRQLTLPARSFCQNGNHQVFKRYHSNVELHEFGVC